MPNTQFWTKEVYNDKDYIFKWDIIEKSRWTFKSNNKIQYHQKWNSCFIFWALWAVSDLTWVVFTEKEQDELIATAWASKYADPKWWWYFWYWMNLVCKFYNKNYAKGSERLEYYRVPSSEFPKFWEKWYSIFYWYKNTKKLVADKRDDWILNFSWWDYTWDDKWNWHWIRILEDTSRKIVNNYWWLSSVNIYWVDDYEKQIENWMFFNFWYVPVIKDWTKDWTEWFSLKENEEFLRNRKEVKK
jgi:hypothetical protein